MNHPIQKGMGIARDLKPRRGMTHPRLGLFQMGLPETLKSRATHILVPNGTLVWALVDLWSWP